MSNFRPKRVEASTLELPDDGLAVMTGDRSGALMLNPMGSVVWQLLDGTRTVEEIADFILESVGGADRAQVIADVEALLVRLREARLLEDATP